MSVVALVSALKGVTVSGNVHVDVAIALHRVTAIMLLVASIFSTAKQFFGDPINCIVDVSHEGFLDFFQTYCWFHGTVTVAAANKFPDSAHHGILQSDLHGQQLEHLHHGYYQWVCFVLLFQAVLCYAPGKLWSWLEGGKAARMLEMTKESPKKEKPKKDDAKEEVVDEAGDSVKTKSPNDRLNHFFTARIGTNSEYGWQYFLCLGLGLANAVGQIYLMNAFLGGQFSRFGFELLANNDDDIRKRIFPTVTKCTLKRYSVSGMPQNHEGLCILPLNIINEKIFIVLWFWFVVLACASAYLLLTKLVLVFSAAYRRWMLRFNLPGAIHKGLGPRVGSLGFADWHLLVQLASNMDPVEFRELLDQLESNKVSAA